MTRSDDDWRAVKDGTAETVGKTPIIRVRGFERELPSVELLAKAEYLNPSGSVKDRLALHFLEGLERQRKLSEGATLVIPTTGNLAISVALLARKPGYKLVVLVPERTSQDRIRLLRSLGAEILRTPNNAHPGAGESHIGLARKVVERVENGVLIDEFHDLTTSEAYKGLADEIYEQCEGRVDAVFIGVESGGAAAGLNRYLKPRIPNLKLIAVEPSHSSLSGNTVTKTKTAKTWRVEDLGNTFVPDVLIGTAFDGWMNVDDHDAYGYARRLCITNGLLCGPSSGATVSAAVRYAARQGLPDSARVVVVLNDTARNYQSTLLSDEWLVENDLVDEFTAQHIRYRATDKYRGASIEDLQLPAAVCVNRLTPISHALDIMVTNNFSQVPVINDDRGFVGFLSLENVQLRLESAQAMFEDPVEKWMYTFSRSGLGNPSKGYKSYKVITPDTSLAELDEFFEHFPAAFITDEHRKFCLGVVTKYDLVSFLSRRPQSSRPS